MAMAGRCNSSTANLDEYVNAADEKFGVEGDNEVPDDICCQLEPGHAGNHYGLIQAYSPVGSESPGDEAWLSWGTGPPVIVYAVLASDFCTELPREVPVATDGWRGNDRDRMVDHYRCGLLAGHCGGHSWSGWRPPTPAEYYADS